MVQGGTGVGPIAERKGEKVLTPVQFSKWAAPIVPVVKRDKSIRICEDFKLTVNHVSHLESYPLSCVEDLFAALTEGTVFTKLDLSQAYLQVEVDDTCRKYLTVNTHKVYFNSTDYHLEFPQLLQIFRD